MFQDQPVSFPAICALVKPCPLCSLFFNPPPALPDMGINTNLQPLIANHSIYAYNEYSMGDYIMDITLKRGDKGESVRKLQERLKREYIPIEPDGLFGPATELAVKIYQLGQQIDADGVVGTRTWNRFDDSNGYQLLSTRYRKTA